MEESGEKPTTFLYNILLSGYRQGLFDEASKVPDSMLCEGLELDLCTYSILIDVYGKQG